MRRIVNATNYLNAIAERVTEPEPARVRSIIINNRIQII
jgi:hypothetical protein